jgi:HTH-type transcriptional regulator/antitoxin HigA
MSSDTPSDFMISITNDKDYHQALSDFKELISIQDDDGLSLRRYKLALAIEEYERRNQILTDMDPIEAIQHRMNQLEMKQKDLVDVIGFKSRVSEILNRRRKLTIEMVRKINTFLIIPSEILIRDYPTQS